MSTPVQTLAAPYYSCPLLFDAPDRRSFGIARFRGFWSALRMVFKLYRDKTLLQAELAYNEALKAHSIGQYADAESGYNRCLSLFPEHEPALNNLAALFVQQNSPELAEAQLETAIKVRPRYFRAYYNLGLVCQYMDRADRAEAAFQQALKLNKSHFWSHFALAEIHAGRNEIEQAAERYRLALPHAKNTVSVHLRMAELFCQVKNYAEADACLRAAIKTRSSAETYYNLGWTLVMQNRDPAEAVDLFRLAERGRPNFKEAMFNLALALAWQGSGAAAVNKMTQYVKTYVKKDVEETIEHLNLLLQVNPGNLQVHLSVASLYLQANQAPQAIDTLNEALNIDAYCEEALVQLADTYQMMGRHKEAIRTYRKLIKVAPEEISGYLGLSRAYCAIENFTAAGPALEKALELDPNNAELHYQYATLLAQEGELETAYSHYKKVAALNPEYPRILKRIKMLEAEFEEETDPGSMAPWPDRARP